MNQSLTERVTRLLAFMLRHQPEQFDLEVDAFGYADIEDVLDALSERVDDDLEAEDLKQAIEEGNRPRYEIVNGKIRALYGHSIAVEPGEPAQPPELLYVGLPAREAERAVENGLRSGRRRFLHLALTSEDAMETGRRSAVEYSVITIYALDGWEDGINFYDRKSLFLAEEIPTNLLEVGPVHTDGTDPAERSGRSGGGRGRDRGRDRGRGDGRGDGRGRGRGRGRGGRSSEREERPSSDHREAAPVEASGEGEARRERSSSQRESAPRRSSRGRDGGGRTEGSRGGDSRSGGGRSGGSRSGGSRSSGGGRGGERQTERSGREERAPRSDQDSVKPAARVTEKPAATQADSGFGKGIFAEQSEPAKPKKARAPKPERAKPEPKPAAPEPSAQEPPSSFGAGL